MNVVIIVLLFFIIHRNALA